MTSVSTLAHITNMAGSAKNDQKPTLSRRSLNLASRCRHAITDRLPPRNPAPAPRDPAASPSPSPPPDPSTRAPSAGRSPGSPDSALDLPPPPRPPPPGPRGATTSSARPPARGRSPRPPDLRILVAPSGFKESLGPEAVADAIEQGIRRVVVEDTATVAKLPLHDGGEGFARAVVAAARGGEVRGVTVTGPVGAPVPSHFGLVGAARDTAVLDVASAAGLGLVPAGMRDPARTTTFGVGELMAAALEADGVGKIVVGCGDSGTSDGGAGMLQALGVRLVDAAGAELPRAAGGGTLTRLAGIDMAGLHPRLRDGGVRIEAVCNIKNVLCGPHGVARVYGPQKGATEEQVEILSSGLDNFASLASGILNEDISTKPGSGASGGLGAGLMLLGAKLRARSEAINEYFHIDDIFTDRPWDFVFTAEGSLDHQSTKGKMTVEIARRARDHGAQVIALAGTIGAGADSVYDEGIEAFASISRGPSSLDEAIRETETLLRDAAERTMRLIQTGMALRPSEIGFVNSSSEWEGISLGSMSSPGSKDDDPFSQGISRSKTT